MQAIILQYKPTDTVIALMPAGVPTTMNLDDTVTVQEGDSVNIACNSSGNPVPTISWYLGDSLAPFSPSNTVIDFHTDVSRQIPGDQTSPNVFSFTEGNITSVLRIENAVYPAHDGEYTCVGLNSHRAVDNTNNATITVQVQGRRLVAYTCYQFSATLHVDMHSGSL